MPDFYLEKSAHGHVFDVIPVLRLVQCYCSLCWDLKVLLEHFFLRFALPFDHVAI